MHYRTVKKFRSGFYDRNKFDTAIYNRVIDFFFLSVVLGMTTIEHLELVMPRYVAKGGDVVIQCEHDVPPEQLYKVEWRKERVKIFRYIKGRNPPYVAFDVQGALLVVSETICIYYIETVVCMQQISIDPSLMIQSTPNPLSSIFIVTLRRVD